MSDKKADPANAVHQAGDRDVEFNGSGYILNPYQLYVPDPRSKSDQEFYEIQNGQRGSSKGDIGRHKPDGPLDHDFGNGGRFTFPFMDDLYPTVLDSEGFIFSTDQKETTITCVGVSEFLKPEGTGSLVNVPAAIRIFATGKPDIKFGKGGKQLFKLKVDGEADTDRKEYFSPWNSVRASVRQQDGSILFPCRLINDRVATFHLVKLDVNGLPAKGYGDNGVEAITPTSDLWADYAAGSDGSVTLVGHFNNGRALGVVSRYTSTGVLDTQFAGGRKIIDLPELPSVTSILLKKVWYGDKDGVTLHANIHDSTDGKDKLVIIKLTKYGEYDPAFHGGQPLVVPEVDTSIQTFALMEIDDQQRTVISYNQTALDVRLIRLLKDGNGDLAFGSDGSVVHPNIGPVTELIIQNGVDILLKAYYRENGNNRAVLFRFFGESAA
ncbi:hypothetical protein [Pseudomonas sp. W2-17]|uniref:hypothetical protein n=1 Tax=Pseudomonas sp. W2-17 TaxID=3058039 RepID=UPI0034E0C749